MVERADTEDVRRMLGEGAQVLEVLPRSHYDEEHLSGAISLPLRTIDARSIQSLDLERPIVTYCYDYQCDLSSRAAHLLEALGCTQVYDYVASKAAWKACGLPTEGTAVQEEGPRRSALPTHPDVRALDHGGAAPPRDAGRRLPMRHH